MTLRPEPKPEESPDNSVIDQILQTASDVVPPTEPEPAPRRPFRRRLSELGRVFRGNRALWITTGVAILSLVAGLGVGRFVLAPADANQAPPAPGFITVPVEYGELSNDVVMRGQVGYADSTEVKLTASELAAAAVVTGQIPTPGSELDARSIALEIAGRPVFVLPGGLPSYRTLRVGMSGPDAKQLNKALRSLGLPAGRSSNKFDESTSEGVRRLYRDAGYPVPVDSEARKALPAARQAARDADQGVVQARIALAEARRGPSASVRKQANMAVAAAARALADARASGAGSSVIAGLKDELALAKIQRREALRRGDLSGPKAALKAAQQQRSEAGKQLRQAARAALPYLPASEALFLTHLPRRVDSVNVTRGSVIDGPVMSVSGARTELSGSVADSDLKLLQVGAEAFFELPDGAQHRAVIETIEAGQNGERSKITFTPDPLTPDQLAQLQGSNVRLQIPVGATEGKVLSVPFAALTAGPGGESRVEVVDGDPRDKARATTRLVTVTTGLAANGYVEINPIEGELKAGDLVVVGK